MEEPKDFISWIGIVPDPRIVGMVTYPLGDDHCWLALVRHAVPDGGLGRDRYFAEEQVDWLRRFRFANGGIASAQDLANGVSDV